MRGQGFCAEAGYELEEEQARYATSLDPRLAAERPVQIDEMQSPGAALEPQAGLGGRTTRGRRDRARAETESEGSAR